MAVLVSLGVAELLYVRAVRILARRGVRVPRGQLVLWHAGIALWWSALEPKRRRLGGELWKIGHILGARLIGKFLGMGFVIVRQPLYADVYGAGERGLGLSALDDQRLAGALMVGLDIGLLARETERLAAEFRDGEARG